MNVLKIIHLLTLVIKSISYHLWTETGGSTSILDAISGPMSSSLGIFIEIKSSIDLQRCSDQNPEEEYSRCS